MKILSVDIALRKSGVVILDSKSGKVTFNDTLKVSTKLSRTEALLSIYDYFESLFKKELNDIEDFTLIMEDVMTYGHLKAAVAIESARTSATLAYHHVGRGLGLSSPILYASPGLVKGHYTGKRGAKKPELFEKFITSHNQHCELFNTLDEDQKDAFILGYYAIETQITS